MPTPNTWCSGPIRAGDHELVPSQFFLLCSAARGQAREGGSGLGYCWMEAQKAHTGKGINNLGKGFPGGAVVENPPANAGDTGSSPGLGGSHMPRSN